MKEAAKSATTFTKRRILQPSEAQIRDRAYKLYLERGRFDGQDRSDWLEAERELRNILAG